jgi:hypothetical protein
VDIWGSKAISIEEQAISMSSGIRASSISLSWKYHGDRLRRIRFATRLYDPGANEDELSQASCGSAWIDFLAYATSSFTLIGLA